jgi:hypothetical protein
MLVTVCRLATWTTLRQIQMSADCGPGSGLSYGAQSRCASPASSIPSRYPAGRNEVGLLSRHALPSSSEESQDALKKLARIGWERPI